MLPVQTVMIRYMVLVYRWGDGWLSAAGDWSGFAGGDVTGGCARQRVLAEAHSLQACKGPADVGPAGPKNYQKTKLIIRSCHLLVKIFNRNLIFSYACVSFFL